MNYSELYENKLRGTFDFPIELYYVDPLFSRYQMPLHWHFEYELILIQKGEFELTLNGEVYHMKKGDTAFIGGGVVHGGTPDECIYECIVFDLEKFMKNSPMPSKQADDFLNNYSGKYHIFNDEEDASKLIDSLFEAMELENRGYEWTTVGLMWQLIGNLTGNGSYSESVSAYEATKLKSVLSYIKNNFGNAVSLEALAKQANMSPKYFCRYFAKVTGKTPIEYLNYYRIEIACERLLMTNESITGIALSCGFNDMSYFSKTFAKYKDMSPSKYRTSKWPIK